MKRDRRQVAVVGRRGRMWVAEPVFEPGPTVALDRRKGAQRAGPGELALVEFGPGRARVVRPLGRADVARDVVEALLWDRLGWVGFRGKLERQAEAMADEVAADPGPRRDLTELPTFTVDPATARDFDDAVSARREGDSVRIWVHIADVAAHIRPKSALDREALRRGNSTYVPGMVEPMLPNALSARACSLSPGDIRPGVTTEMLIGPEGEVAKVAFYRSLVRSDHRLDYDQLDRVFAGRERPPEPVAEPLALTREVAAVLAERRGPEALEISTSEPDFGFDSKGHVEAAVAVTDTEAHRLIERLMVLTNEQVAAALERRRIPTLYRVHERPDPRRVAFLADRLADLEVPTPALPDPLQPADAAEAVGEISRQVAAAVAREGRGAKAFTSMILQQARYSDVNLGHAGLGSAAYCHFTSPIRRYPDLIVHRGLLSMLGEGEEAPLRSEVEAAAISCSDSERQSVSMEREADDICAAFLLERELFEGDRDRVFSGEVVGMVRGGVFVAFAGERSELYEGFLPIGRLGDEWYETNELETALIGKRSGNRVRLGDAIEVIVDRIERLRGRVTLGQRPGQADRQARPLSRPARGRSPGSRPRGRGRAGR